MNSKQNDRANLIDQARELLSPYLDDEVSAAERILVEEMLAESPDLQNELASLHQTVNLVKSMPRVPAPRPFTLTEVDVGLAPPEKRSFFQAWFKPFMGAVAALTAVIVVGILVFNLRSIPGQQATSVAIAPRERLTAQTLKAEAPAAEAVLETSPVEEPAAAEPRAAPMEVEVQEVVVEAEVVVEEKAEMADVVPAKTMPSTTMATPAVQPTPSPGPRFLTERPAAAEKEIFEVQEAAEPGPAEEPLEAAAVAEEEDLGRDEALDAEAGVEEEAEYTEDAAAMEMTAPLGEGVEGEADLAAAPPQPELAQPEATLPASGVGEVEKAAEAQPAPTAAVSLATVEEPADSVTAPPQAPSAPSAWETPSDLTRQRIPFWLIAPLVALVVVGAIIAYVAFSRSKK